jgi:hypothetical protein
VKGVIAVLEPGVILRMFADQIGELRLERSEQCAGLRLFESLKPTAA